MKSTIREIFKTSNEAYNAINQLAVEGIHQDQVSVLMSDETHSLHGKEFDIQDNSKAPEGIAIGATAGGIIGAVAAGLTTVGSIVMTGGAGLVVPGPAIAALAGLGAGAAGGGLIGGLIGLGINETEAKQIEEDLKSGSVLVAVEAKGDEKDRVKEVFKNAKKREKEQLDRATA